MSASALKRATGPSGLRLENDWATVMVDYAYGEWEVYLCPNANRPTKYRTADGALKAAIAILAEEAQR